MGTLMSVDPKGHGSLRGKPGFAWFDNGELAAVLGKFSLVACDILVIELPQVYQHGRSKGDPNDLIRVAFYAGAVAGALGYFGGLLTGKLLTPTPGDWKGQVPKAIHHERIRRVLSTKELGLVSRVDHNVMDAVGLGLWALGRLPK